MNPNIKFADPGGVSALRAETEDNPRNLPCPTCKAENVLTPEDKARGYQCDVCAADLEGPVTGATFFDSDHDEDMDPYGDEYSDGELDDPY